MYKHKNGTYSIDGYTYPATTRDDDEDDYVPGTAIKPSYEDDKLEYEMRRCMILADPNGLQKLRHDANFWGFNYNTFWS